MSVKDNPGMISPRVTPSLKRALRARAHHLKPVVMIGQHGLRPPVIDEIDQALEHHELIKVKFQGADKPSRNLMIEKICTKCDAAFIQGIGHVAVFYRSSPE